MRTRGFSLIELVITISILGIVAALSVTPVLESVKQYAEVSARLRLLDEGRLALDVMAREVRQIKSAADVTTFTDTVLLFNKTDGTNVRWEKNGSSLDRNTVSACGYVTAFDFDYLDGSGAAAATADAIRLVEITLTLSDAGETVQLRTSAAPRNLLPSYSVWDEQ